MTFSCYFVHNINIFLERRLMNESCHLENKTSNKTDHWDVLRSFRTYCSTTSVTCNLIYSKVLTWEFLSTAIYPWKLLRSFNSALHGRRLTFTSSLHCFWHIWQYHRSFCNPLALILLDMPLGVKGPAFSFPILQITS